MGRPVYGLGAAVGLGFIIGALGLVALMRGGTAFDPESKAYVDNSIVAIAAGWDAEELWKRGTPHFREFAQRDDLRAFLTTAGTALGPLTQYGGARGGAKMLVVNYHTLVSANYVAKGSFQNGEADFQLAVVKLGDSWMIDGFRVSSPALAKRVAGLRG